MKNENKELLERRERYYKIARLIESLEDPIDCITSIVDELESAWAEGYQEGAADNY